MTSLPTLGVCCSDSVQFDTTMSAIGRTTVQWALRYSNDNNTPNTSQMDALAQRGVANLIVSYAVEATLDSILAGERCSRLVACAQLFKTWQDAHPGTKLWLRPMWEMNGNWYQWGTYNGYLGNTPEKYVAAWKHVWNCFRGAFPTLSFFWCPNKLLGGQTSYLPWYPGDAFVDAVGIDAYNHSQSEGGWQPITQVMNPSLAAIRAVSPSKLLIVGETATTEPKDGDPVAAGHTKAEWFGNTMGNMGYWLRNDALSYGVGVVNYFDYPKVTPTTGNNYRIYDPNLPSGVNSRDAFRLAISGIG